MAEKEIVFDEDYSGQRFTYGLQYRPLGISCQPDGFIIGSNKEHESFGFGTIDYPFQLTEKQMASYELIYIKS